ncbi:flagellar brake protein [Thiocystis violacea]|uniref:flagellar brake protein n=1 Tax=Thiocystis violacea TaxID=13725 RepID=UPI0019049EF4|nr:flagellar brake protein [Thiocystis violacea]
MNQKQSQDNPGHHGDFENYDLVSDPTRIAAALTEINRHLVLVSVRLDAEGPLYDSRVVRLDEDRELLYLSQLEPSDAQTDIGPGQDLYVFATMRGIAVRFTVTIDDVLPTETDRFYACPYPERMLYLQRRELFRVPLPRHEHRSVKIRPQAEGPEIIARILDLSVRGFCLEVKASEISHSQVGSTYQYLGMDLPDTRTPLAGEAVLVNLRASPTCGFLAAGFAITDLDPLIERSLMRAALYYQRDTLKTGA